MSKHNGVHMLSADQIGDAIRAKTGDKMTTNAVLSRLSRLGIMAATTYKQQNLYPSTVLDNPRLYKRKRAAPGTGARRTASATTTRPVVATQDAVSPPAGAAPSSDASLLRQVLKRLDQQTQVLDAILAHLTRPESAPTTVHPSGLPFGDQQKH